MVFYGNENSKSLRHDIISEQTDNFSKQMDIISELTVISKRIDLVSELIYFVSKLIYLVAHFIRPVCAPSSFRSRVLENAQHPNGLMKWDKRTSHTMDNCTIESGFGLVSSDRSES